MLKFVGARCYFYGIDDQESSWSLTEFVSGEFFPGQNSIKRAIRARCGFGSSTPLVAEWQKIPHYLGEGRRHLVVSWNSTNGEGVFEYALHFVEVSSQDVRRAKALRKDWGDTTTRPVVVVRGGGQR